MTPVVRWLIVTYLLVGAYCTAGCKHAYQHHENASRIDQEHRTSQTVARAEEKQQQSGTVRKNRHRVHERFRPDGTLRDRTTTDSSVAIDWSNVRAGSSSVSITAAADRRTDANSNSGTTSSTTWWPPWWLWALGGLAVAAVAWFLWWRARRLRLV